MTIIHPLMKVHFDSLVKTLNGLSKIKKIRINYPDDESTYYV